MFTTIQLCDILITAWAVTNNESAFEAAMSLLRSENVYGDKV